MDGSFAECSVEDKRVDNMPNVTKLSVEDNPFLLNVSMRNLSHGLRNVNVTKLSVEDNPFY